MNIVRCDQGHFYDLDATDFCPTCRKLAGTGTPSRPEDLVMGRPAHIELAGVPTIQERKDWKESLLERIGRRQKQTQDEETEPAGKVFAAAVEITSLYDPRSRLEFYMQPGIPRCLGRGPSADVVPDPEDQLVSRKHCFLQWKNGRLYLQATTALNGTYLNGNLLPPERWVPVSSGDILQIGRGSYRVTVTVLPGAEGSTPWL